MLISIDELDQLAVHSHVPVGNINCNYNTNSGGSICSMGFYGVILTYSWNMNGISLVRYLWGVNGC